MTISDYLKNMRKDRIWGGNLELMAFAELYRKTIHVYRSGPTPDHIFGYGYSEVQQEEPIRLHFTSGNHYESLLSHKASQCFLVDEAGVIEENNLNQYKKLKSAEKCGNHNVLEEEKEPLSTEEINIQLAIQESIKLQKMEKERADNRKRYEQELMKALKLSMEKG